MRGEPDQEENKIEDRVRDLEEDARASSKSRQAMHKQLGDISYKLDALLSKMESKNEECAQHQTELALLKLRVAAVEVSRQELYDNGKWASRTAVTSLIGLVLGLIAYVWKVMTAAPTLPPRIG